MKPKKLNQLEKSDTSWFSARHVLGWVFIVVAFSAAVAWVYLMQKNDTPGIGNITQHAFTPAELKGFYSNDIIGFEIHYPESWTVNDKTYPGEVCFASPAKVEAMKSQNYEGTCGEIVLGTTSYVDSAAPGSLTLKKLGGIRYTYYAGGAAYENASYLYVGNKYYNFETEGGSVVESILATFKPTKQSDTTGWKTYSNKAYNYQISYPGSGWDVNPTGPSLQEPNQWSSAVVGSLQGGLLVEDKQNVQSENHAPEMAQALSLPLKDYAQKIWQDNVNSIKTYPGKQVGSLTEFDLNGNTAYKFTLTDSYISDDVAGGYSLGDEEFMIVATARNNIKYFVSYPNTEFFQTIFSTFKFTK